MRPARIAVQVLLVFAATAVLASSASAAAIFDYSINLDDGVQAVPAGGNVGVSRLDNTKSTRIIITQPSGPNRYDSGTIAATPTSFDTPQVAGLAPGDTITV